MNHTQKGKRVLALLLAAVMTLTLAGCKEETPENPESQQTPGVSAAGTSGRWVQQEVTPTQQAYSFNKPVVLSDGSVLLMTKNGDDSISLWSSQDNGASWEEQTNQWKEQTGASYFGTCCTLPNGSSFVIAIEDDGANRSWTCWAGEPGASQLQQITLPENIQEISDVQPLNDHTVLFLGMMLTPATADAPSVLLDGNGMMRVMSAWELDLSTGSCTEWTDFTKNLGSSSISGMARDPSGEGDAFYYLSYQESGTNLMYRTLDGTVTTAFENLPDASGAAFASAADQDGNYYYGSSSGIYRIAKDGDLAELVVESAGAVLEKTTATLMGMAVCKDGSFLVLSMEDDSQTGEALGSHLYRIYWDESAPVEETSLALTVWSLDNNDTIRAAISEYQAQNPGQKVEYQVALEDGTSKEDAVSALNAALLAGSGPDVLVLDGMDWEAYRDQGLLEDISGTLPLDTLQPNLAGPFQQEGQVYVMPARFAVPVLCGQAEDLAGLDNLEALAQKLLALPARPAFDCQSQQYYEQLDQPYGLGFISLEQLLDFTLESSASALVQDGINAQAAEEILSFVQQVGSYYGMDQYQNFISNAVVAGDNSGAGVAYGDGGYECFFTHNARMAWDTMNTPAYLEAVLGEEGNYTVTLRPGLAEGAYLPSTLTAISASSSHSQEARQFLEILFGDQVQSSWQQDGMPVQAAALQESMESNCTGAALEQIKALIESLKTPVTMPDDTVYQALLQYAQELIQGKTTLDQAQAGVENALKLYLAEQE